MFFRSMVGSTKYTEDTICEMVKAGEALSFGDVVKLGTQVSGDPLVVAAKVAADNIGVLGVVCEPGGIASGAIGAIVVKGPALMNCDSQTAWAVGLSINTNGITLGGTGNDGTMAVGKGIGYSMGLEAGTVTQQTVYVNPS